MTSAKIGGRRRRSPRFTIGLTLIALILFSGLCALGSWQVYRLAWKRDLIARVDARIHAAPVPAPRSITSDDEYRRVAASGHFLHDKAVLTQAVTVRGPGFWVMTLCPWSWRKRASRPVTTDFPIFVSIPQIQSVVMMHHMFC